MAEELKKSRRFEIHLVGQMRRRNPDGTGIRDYQGYGLGDGQWATTVR